MVERTITDVVRTIEAGEFYQDYDQSSADLRILRNAAGYRILGPDEVDPVTMEKCAEVADTFEDWGDFGGYLETASGQIATRIRALGRNA